jgi:hypothetical protein
MPGISAPQNSPSARVGRLPVSDGASTTGSLSLHLYPSLLAGTRRLTVPARPYVVSAAPSLTPNSGIGLRSTSTGRRNDQRRSPFTSARFQSASWRTLRDSRPGTPRRRGIRPRRPQERTRQSPETTHPLPSPPPHPGPRPCGLIHPESATLSQTHLRMRPPRRALAHSRGPRTRHPVLGPLVQHHPATQRHRLHTTS